MCIYIISATVPPARVGVWCSNPVCPAVEHWKFSGKMPEYRILSWKSSCQGVAARTSLFDVCHSHKIASPILL